MGIDTLAGKVALVTGASRGIGAATSLELAGRGAAVAVNYRTSEQHALAVADRIERAGGRAITARGDITSSTDVVAMAEVVARDLGEPDILVLNAHGFDEAIREFPLDIEPETLVSVVSGQLRAVMLPVRAFVPGMVKRGSGSVVFVSAVLARDPWIRSIAAGTAKAAMEAVAKFLSRYTAPHGVRVNTAIVGVTRTDAAAQVPKERLAEAVRDVPMGRMGEPEEVARAIAALCTDDMSYVTGAFVPTCGGSLIL
ncbi:SDR family oxidoreductase [Nonomuraea sp. NPDC049158]|uniref:SDR family NAD(P)-dependent oxidoreductase n=1 Tax=Nonomuraea sp. NPDC049158 TaxID=3155649 RepID=UPI0033D0A755